MGFTRPIQWIKKPLGNLGTGVRRLWTRYTVSPNPHALFVLGNQKSGTTAIAALLAAAAGKTVCLDFFYKLNPLVEIDMLKGILPLSRVVDEHRRWFAFDIVKEPGLTFVLNSLLECFPQAQFLFIIRDPRDNIRSILNRLALPGNLEDMKSEHWDTIPTLLWKNILEGKLFGEPGCNYIETLAKRWNMAIQAYQRNVDRIHLVRYEDFVANKTYCILQLIDHFGFKIVRDISDQVDVQYQSKGDHSITWIDFFGSDNLERIERICREGMRQFGYTVGGSKPNESAAR
ncbi:MAG: sulfotransferase [Sedimentisphaerales bacterium]|nr:sulfotransferase [Sedimentisphaerales bacterium]